MIKPISFPQLVLALLVTSAYVPVASASDLFPADDAESADVLDVHGQASEEELEAARGKQGVDILSVSQETQAQQNAQVNGNSLSGVTTGDNIVESGAFKGAAGHTTLIQNSGNQVVIQENTIYNITFAP